MSVPKHRRDTAPAEFVRTAAQLEAFTGKVCTRLPKRWAFTRTRYITDCANSILDHVVRANAIWATTSEEVAQRMEHLTEAYAACYTLLRKIDMIEEDMPVRVLDGVNPDGTVVKVEKPCLSAGLLREWTILATAEIKLIKGVINSDRKRYAQKRHPVARKRGSVYSRKRSRASG